MVEKAEWCAGFIPTIAMWISVFLPADTGSVPPWGNMVVGEVPWYIRWYDPAETHNVPAVRFGMDFYICNVVEERGEPPFPSWELISTELQLSHLQFFPSHWKSSNPCELLSSSVGKNNTRSYLANLRLPRQCRQSSRHIITEPRAQPATCRQTAHHLRERNETHFTTLSDLKARQIYLA